MGNGGLRRFSTLISLLTGLTVGLYYGYAHQEFTGAIMFGLLSACTAFSAFIGTPPTNTPALRSFSREDRRAAQRIVRRGEMVSPGLAPVVLAEAEAFLRMKLPRAWLSQAIATSTILFGAVAFAVGIEGKSEFVLMALLSVAFGVMLLSAPATSKHYRGNAVLAAARASAWSGGRPMLLPGSDAACSTSPAPRSRSS
jgi:hypothetical protein